MCGLLREPCGVQTTERPVSWKEETLTRGGEGGGAQVQRATFTASTRPLQGAEGRQWGSRPGGSPGRPLPLEGPLLQNPGRSPRCRVKFCGLSGCWLLRSEVVLGSARSGCPPPADKAPAHNVAAIATQVEGGSASLTAEKESKVTGQASGPKWEVWREETQPVPLPLLPAPLPFLSVPTASPASVTVTPGPAVLGPLCSEHREQLPPSPRPPRRNTDARARTHIRAHTRTNTNAHARRVTHTHMHAPHMCTQRHSRTDTHTHTCAHTTTHRENTFSQTRTGHSEPHPPAPAPRSWHTPGAG